MSVLVLSKYDRLGASSRLRMFQYFPFLESSGIELTVDPLFGDWYLNSIYSFETSRYKWFRIVLSFVQRLLHVVGSSRHDLVWIQGEMFPWLPGFAEKILVYLNIPYVVDYDDAVFHRYDMHRNHLVRKLLGEKIDTVMRQASLVVVGNDYLAERAERAGSRKVEILPTVVNCDRYCAIPRKREDVFTVGWIGTPKTAPYLFGLAGPLAQLSKVSRIRLVVVGVEHFTMSGVHVDCLPWRESWEVHQINTFDVGIMPLPDEPWERGKCGYKLIQYMACEKPVIASPVGINCTLVENGQNGFVANTDKDWLSALEDLQFDDELRHQLGKNGRRRVEESYSLQVCAPKLVSLFRSI